MDSNSLFDYLVKIQAITKIGLLYSTDPYAIHNYAEIQKLTLELLENLQDVKLGRNNYFLRDIYPTPNISVRTIIYNDNNEFILVEENGGGYSLPGGWADLYDSPLEAAKRENMEEAGANATNYEFVALLNRTPYKSKNNVPEYALFLKAKFVEFIQGHDHEINSVSFFSSDKLPSFSSKVSEEEMKQVIKLFTDNKTHID